MSKTFTILITGSPTQTQAHLSAFRFIDALVEQKHSVNNVFFYQEAVAVANQLTCLPSDELNLNEKWKTLSEKHNFELQVCVAAANRRGVINSQEAEQNNKTASSIDEAFKVLGLGQFAAVLSEKKHNFIQFK